MNESPMNRPEVSGQTHFVPRLLLIVGAVLSLSTGCTVRGAVVVVPHDGPDGTNETDGTDGALDGDALRAPDSQPDARALLDAADAMGDADATDGDATALRDAPNDDGPVEAACATVDPALTALRDRGVAVSPNRNTFETNVRLYYVTSTGTLRMELRDAALARVCSVDLGAPPGITLFGTPTVALRREHVFVAGRDGAGVIEYWGRFSTNERDASCATLMHPWEQLPAPPSGARLVTAPAALLMPDVVPDDPVYVAGQAEDGSVYLTERPTTIDGPRGTWSTPRALVAMPSCRTIGARPRLLPVGPNAAQLFSLQIDSRGGYSNVEWRWSVGGAPGQRPPEFVSTARPTAPTAGHLWPSLRDFGQIDAHAVGGEIFARGYGFAIDGVSRYHDPIRISAPPSVMGSHVTSLLVINGPGSTLWNGADGNIYIIAQFANDPSVLHFAVAIADEWFSPGLPITWQTSASRLE